MGIVCNTVLPLHEALITIVSECAQVYYTELPLTFVHALVINSCFTFSFS
jgi:hypothetical protein